jgi:anti-sigma B factor antagonist
VQGELDIQPMVTVVTLHGELDMLTVDNLRQLLSSACVGDPDRVVVDLNDVPFVDVLSLSTILATADSLRERGAALTVVGASSAVRRICSLLNADDVLVPMLPMPRAAFN